jgi:hypothetical protein
MFMPINLQQQKERTHHFNCKVNKLKAKRTKIIKKVKKSLFLNTISIKTKIKSPSKIVIHFKIIKVQIKRDTNLITNKLII